MRCNEQIRLSPVRLVDENNEQIGVVPTDEALRRAREAGLDLVEVAPNERPPVCRIMDFGKWKYQQKKKHKKHHEQQLKELRMSPKTDSHDMKIKVDRAREFLGHGDKVQFTMVFRGRERFHQDRGSSIFHEIITTLGEAAKVERPPRTEGRRMIMILTPGKVSPKPAAPKPAAPVTRPAATAPAPTSKVSAAMSPDAVMPPRPDAGAAM